ncbi:hypothetical protein COV18_02920 [Candidatus Woesearchaeota archaeon CG10_big_fil_rev_8_21_14_0_10_37_12]|nr:MAG: hypothetical protein COV18_02920 [Candidatus Woesearchaeota archaeon CG10_big_fil_rev_8_21_14_0_10_37_12]
MKYLDTNVFILALTGNKKAKQILLDVASQEIDGATSCLTWDEFIWILRKQFKRSNLLEESKKFLNFPNLRILDITSNTLQKAHSLVELYELKPRDVIHAAAAIEHNITDFISDNDNFDIITEFKRVQLS